MNLDRRFPDLSNTYFRQGPWKPGASFSYQRFTLGVILRKIHLVIGRGCRKFVELLLYKTVLSGTMKKKVIQSTIFYFFLQ